MVGLLTGILPSLSATAEQQPQPSQEAELREPAYAKDLRHRLFKADAKDPSCLIISRGLDKRYETIDPSFGQIISDIQQLIAKSDAGKLRDLFHPRLKVGSKKASTLINELYGAFDTNQANLFRIFALNTIDGTPYTIECTEDQLSIGTHYGYPLQFGVWFQFAGKHDLGRLYLTLVSSENGWRIGAWHRQQWTHLGKDAEVWSKEALADAAADRKYAAYLKLDVAQKLLDGGKFVFMQFRKDLEATRSTQLGEGTTWMDILKPHFGKQQVVYASSQLASDGAGIYLRIAIPGETKVPELEAACKEVGLSIYKQPWTDGIGGLHCDFTDIGAPPEIPGRWGGLSFSSKELKEPVAKKK
jgi:hypothetical protein